MTRPFSLILFLVEISKGVDETLEESKSASASLKMYASDFNGKNKSVSSVVLPYAVCSKREGSHKTYQRSHTHRVSLRLALMSTSTYIYRETVRVRNRIFPLRTSKRSGGRPFSAGIHYVGVWSKYENSEVCSLLYVPLEVCCGFAKLKNKSTSWGCFNLKVLWISLRI